MTLFRGAFTALVTPMKENGDIDYDAFKNLVDSQLEGGIDGLVPLGTTGETPTLDEHEEERLIRILMKEVRTFEKEHSKKIPVIIGAGSNNTRDAVRYVERAGKEGADAALVVTPYYNKPSDEGVFRHFEAVSRVGLPIVVYNIQGRTSKNISTPLLARIADLPNIAGVKEASGNINQIMDVIGTIKNVTHPDFAVLSGDDALTLPLIAAGGDGVISVVSNIAPELVAGMVNFALNGKMDEARHAHYHLAPMFRAAFVDGNPSSIKYAMSVKGMSSPYVRLPLSEVSESAKKVIEDAMKECGI